MCRRVRWPWPVVSSGISRAGWRASVRGVLPRRPRRLLPGRRPGRADRMGGAGNRRTVRTAHPHPTCRDGLVRGGRGPAVTELRHLRGESAVTGIKTTGEKKLMFFSGRAHPELAEEVAQELGVGVVPTKAFDFANGEIYVRYQESARGADCFLIQSHTAPINKWIMEQLIMIDALKRASARSITVIVPFYGYARQDKKHRGREPISARLI